MTRKSVKLTNNGVRLTQLSVIFRAKLSDFRVIVDPEWGLASMDPFPGHVDPSVFRVYNYHHHYDKCSLEDLSTANEKALHCARAWPNI